MLFSALFLFFLCAAVLLIAIQSILSYPSRIDLFRLFEKIMEENRKLKAALVDVIAGAISGGVSRTVVAPLDVIKIRFQVQIEPTFRLLPPRDTYGISKYTGMFQATKDILREEGLLGLWRGNVPGLLLWMPYTAIQFAVLRQVKLYVAGSTKAGPHSSNPVHESLQSKESNITSYKKNSGGVAIADCAYLDFELMHRIIFLFTDIQVFEGRVAIADWAYLAFELMHQIVFLFTDIQLPLWHILLIFSQLIRLVRREGFTLFLIVAISLTTALDFIPVFEDHAQLSPYLSYLSGGLAGYAATIASYPFDLLRTVLASQGEPKVYPNLRSAFLEIARTRGIRGLYSGLSPTLVVIVPYAALQFGSNDTFKRWCKAWNQASSRHARNESEEKLSGVQLSLCGFAAGAVAKVASNPLDVVKKRFQVEGLQRHPRYGARVEENTYKGMWHALKRIFQAEGLAGLYKGIVPSVIKAAPASAVTFVAYEYTSNWLESIIK